MNRFGLALLLLTVIIGVFGCDVLEETTPTLTPSQTPTPTETSQQPMTPTPTASSESPTVTPTPTATPSRLPDLIVSDLLQEYVAEVGIYNVTFRICNNGDDDAGASVAGVYIDRSLEATVDVGSLGADDCVDYTTVDYFTESGFESDTVRVCADIDDDVSESDEGNNCMSKGEGSF